MEPPHVVIWNCDWLSREVSGLVKGWVTGLCLQFPRPVKEDPNISDRRTADLESRLATEYWLLRSDTVKILTPRVGVKGTMTYAARVPNFVSTLGRSLPAYVDEFESQESPECEVVLRVVTTVQSIA